MKDITGSYTIIKPVRLDGVPMDRIEVHPGKGFRLVNVNPSICEVGVWVQFKTLSEYRKLYHAQFRKLLSFR